MGNSSISAGTEPPVVDVKPGDGQSGMAHRPEFAPKRTGDDVAAVNDWWTESDDGKCSESASLFAASQSTPLNVV